MKPARPTFEEYRALSAEERELVRLGEARAFAMGELEPTVVKRRKLKRLETGGGRGAAITKEQLVAAIAEGAELDAVQANRALEALAQYVGTTAEDVGMLASFRHEEADAARPKDIDALVEANKAAAAGYQDLFKKQVAIFEETMAEAQRQMQSFDAAKLDERAKAQAELAKAAFEKALANMQALAESAQKANAEAYEIVSAQIQIMESLAELQIGSGNTNGSRSTSPG
jgi:phasin family protein